MKIRLFAIIFLLLFASYESKKFIEKSQDDLVPEKIKEQIIVKTGDIVLKKEDNLFSDFFSIVDNSKFSDIGVVLKIDNKFYVAHYDFDIENSEFLQIEPFKSYVYFANRLAVLRYEKDIDSSKLFDYLETIKNSKISFDYSFNLNTTGFYNSKFVNSVYKELFGEDIYSYSYDFFERDFISINSILQNPKFKKQFDLDFTTDSKPF